MKRSNIKSRINKDELNPLFHFKDKEEDDKILTKGVIRQALKSGKLELSSKSLQFGKQKINLFRSLVQGHETATIPPNLTSMTHTIDDIKSIFLFASSRFIDFDSRWHF